jgi:S-adenosylmethionine:diacylglycerol 3-amino-3-carboxypropyl transferase
VARVLKDGEVNLSFRRNFDSKEVIEWEELERELEGVQLNTKDDTVRWALTKHGQFTSASLYRHCSFSGVLDVRMEDLWHSKLPLKIKNFVWLVFRNRLQTADNLRKE